MPGGNIVLALLIVGGLFVFKLDRHIEHVVNNYSSDKIYKIIGNMEAPAAAGDG
jgi:hypothetical protein